MEGRLRREEAERIRGEVERFSRVEGLRYSFKDMGYVGILHIGDLEVRITRRSWKVVRIIERIRRGACRCKGKPNNVEDSGLALLVSKLYRKGVCSLIERNRYKKYKLILQCDGEIAEINNLTKEGLYKLLLFIDSKGKE